MALERPELRKTRTEDPLTRALRLAREIEELLENVPSPSIGSRMAGAMAASLVSELDSLVSGPQKRSRLG